MKSPNSLIEKLPPEIMKVVHTVSQAAHHLGYSTYIVGGTVRDLILNRHTDDIDFVCVGKGIELAKCTAALLHPRPKVSFFKNYGTAHFRYGNQEYEFVGARRESYAEHSRNPSVEDGTLSDDQFRRDFTINALAISLQLDDFGAFIDPFKGYEDIKKKTIRTPLNPVNTFADDPLRMLRAIRFATQLAFTIHPTTFSALQSQKDRIKIITAERIYTELNKIILAPQPSIGFKILFDTGLLQIIFPELAALQSVKIQSGIGHKDNFYHTLQVLDNLSKNTNDLWIRWAALLHDIAKPATQRFEGNEWTFHGHEVVGARMVSRIFKRLKLPMNENMKQVEKLVLLHLRPISLTKENISDSAIRRLLYDAGEDFEALMLLCEADITSKNKDKVARYLANYEIVKMKCAELEEKDRIRNWQPPVDGELIMQTFRIKPSKEVGMIKNAIRDAILDGIIPNEVEAATNFMIKEGLRLGLRLP